MSHFDTPHTGYGTYMNPIMIFTKVNEEELRSLIGLCDLMKINHERWFLSANRMINKDQEIHIKLIPGIIVYYPQYNCVRGANHFPDADIIPLKDFIPYIRVHPKHLGTMFIVNDTIEQRDQIIGWFKHKGFKMQTGVPILDFELAVFVNVALNMLIVHTNQTAMDNEEDGSWPVMTYERYKIYMA